MNYSNSFFDQLVKDYLPPVVVEWYKWFAALALVLIIGVAGWFSYSTYQATQGQQAQVILSEAILERHKAFQDKTTWEQVSLMANLGYRSYHNTWVAPYLLAIEADSLLNENKLDEALIKLNTALSSTPKNNPFWHLLALKRALFLSQSQEAAHKKEALVQLETLAHDTSNKQRDQALYYLGYVHYIQGNTSQAVSTWQQLVDQFSSPEANQSPLVEIAQEQLTSLAY